mmetsp:Transcript_19785/g.44696  ORF Transcript_19785/g.44696 Transcript_19785/m.44696 type:complete len:203 (-) Transcript_19785:198-806(-)
MSISSTQVLTFGPIFRVPSSSRRFPPPPPRTPLTWLDLTRIGTPVLFLLQIRAILAPSPNFPRVCRTPYLLPDRTRPSKSGIASWAMPHPLSRTVTVKYASPPARFFFSLVFLPFAFLSPSSTISASLFSSCEFGTPLDLLNCASVISSILTLMSGRTLTDSHASSEFSMSSRRVVYSDLPALSNPAIDWFSAKNSAGLFDC